MFEGDGQGNIDRKDKASGFSRVFVIGSKNGRAYIVRLLDESGRLLTLGNSVGRERRGL